ncbi:ENTH domain-containing protein C794.11c-like [Euphorbia lathyris]|uniref:ENTH domain-containing protein C794.11c-like n=1 Tax=Euphorbia lathyris TaxID=212925 RepID=UPI00331344B0
MDKPLLNELKRQASFFFKDKIKTARLALTDVTPAQLLTEEATNGDLWAADTPNSMALISRAAFEVDDYCRIVDILHKRFTKFERKTWRVSYKSLILLEHLLTHGPLRVADEFLTDKEVIQQIQAFQFVDETGFNWGLSVKNLCARILKLLESELFLREERAKARKLTRGIEGFGSFSDHGNFQESNKFWKCSSSNDNDNDEEEYTAQMYELLSSAPEEEYIALEDHPFCFTDNHTKSALLSF